ncbi:uncharacterized protein LOC135334338 [Halichondria panicea]|uniref:uncharacterized protein LOC135334338 n=1 Tax=Halichondria panicea TaxID=6063 RepID=UPI00312BB9CE
MADSQDRVQVWNQKIERDKVRAGDHIYVHEAGGIFNKHGIVIWQDNEDIIVAYYNEESDSIDTYSLENFADGNCIRLYVYGVSKIRKQFTRRGSCSIRRCPLPQEVVQNVLYYVNHLDEVQFKTFRNQSESFATACTSRTSLVVKNPEFPETDDSSLRVKYFTHRIQRDDLKPGDHIYAYRKLRIYAHHGIYIGKNKSGIHIVIHFTGDPGTKKSKSSAKIRTSSLDDFLDGAHLRLVSYDDGSSIIKRSGISQFVESLPASEVVGMAETFAMDPDTWEDYNFFTNNCEHFCIFCKTGKKVKLVYAIFEGIMDQTHNIWVFPVALAYNTLDMLS